MFKPGDSVTWTNRRGQRFFGTVVEIVPPDTHPLWIGWHWREKAAPYSVKFDLELPFTRKTESYLCSVKTSGKPQLWWPRAGTLQPRCQQQERGLFDDIDHKV